KTWSGRRGSNSQLSAWEAEFSTLYFQYPQNASEKMYVHALHAVHALPDLRVAGGRLGDGVLLDSALRKDVSNRKCNLLVRSLSFSAPDCRLRTASSGDFSHR